LFSKINSNEKEKDLKLKDKSTDSQSKIFQNMPSYHSNLPSTTNSQLKIVDEMVKEINKKK
jgi:hypothetical protein